MSPKSLPSRHSVDSCLFQLHSWNPFSSSNNPTPKPLDPDPNPNPKPAGLNSKRPCLSDRATSLFSLSIDHLDLSKLSLFDDKSRFANNNNNAHRSSHQTRREKRRRKAGGSRSVSGRSTDRSGTRKDGRCCSVGATATATCSDFMVANGGTDSSGELFGNAVIGGWASDVSEARRESGVGVVAESVPAGFGFGFDGVVGSESGYGSEPGYRGDAEFGYGGDEGDDDEEDYGRLFLWGDAFAGDSKMEVVWENTFSEQKTHHRGRRKKHDIRMVDSVR